jgi:hypothetical protein
MSGLFALHAHFARPTMAKTRYRKPPPAETVEDMERRTHEESQPETDAEALRSLGWWLIPSNGDEPEVQD